MRLSESIIPQLGMAGGIPSPRKLSEASDHDDRGYSKCGNDNHRGEHVWQNVASKDAPIATPIARASFHEFLFANRQSFGANNASKPHPTKDAQHEYHGSQPPIRPS